MIHLSKGRVIFRELREGKNKMSWFSLDVASFDELRYAKCYVSGFFIVAKA